MIRPLIAARLTDDEDLIEAARDRGSYQIVWLVLTPHAILEESLMDTILRPWCIYTTPRTDKSGRNQTN